MPTDIPNDYYYRLLGVASGASMKAVRGAYKKLAARCDPARFPVGSIEARQAEQIRERLDVAYRRLGGTPPLSRNATTLLRPSAVPPLRSDELLRPAQANANQTSGEELLRPGENGCDNDVA